MTANELKKYLKIYIISKEFIKEVKLSSPDYIKVISYTDTKIDKTNKNISITENIALSAVNKDTAKKIAKLQKVIDTVDKFIAGLEDNEAVIIIKSYYFNRMSTKNISACIGRTERYVMNKRDRVIAKGAKKIEQY